MTNETTPQQVYLLSWSRTTDYPGQRQIHLDEFRNLESLIEFVKQQRKGGRMSICAPGFRIEFAGKYDLIENLKL